MTKQVQRRRGTATQHTSFTGAEGELSVNTTNKSVHVHDNVTAGGFEAARADMDNVTSSSILTAAGITATTAELNYVDGVTSNIQTQLDGKAGTASPTFTGTLTTANLTATGTTTLAGASTSADITFGDNDKAIFGAGSDLQIYHDGSDSFITDTGAGNLQIWGGNFRLRSSDGSEAVIDGNSGGAVTLYYDNAAKLATTSTGVDVTGTITSDGLTVNGNATIQQDDALIFIKETDGTNIAAVGDLTGAGQGGAFYYDHGGTATIQLKSYEASTIENGLNVKGDISFYEDTGTTPKFFWDASAESLGIGTTSPSKKAHLYASNDSASLRLENTANSKVWDITPARPGVANTGLSIHNVTDDRIDLHVDNSGNVGIGTSSPMVALNVHDSTNARIALTNSSTGQTFPDGFELLATGLDAYVQNRSNGNMIFTTNNSEAMRIDSSGNVGIGTSSPDQILHLTKGSGATLRFESTTTGAVTGDIFGAIEFETQDSNSAGVKGKIDAYSEGAVGNTALRFHTGGTLAERMRIDSSGNVGIGGTPTNASDHKSLALFGAANTGAGFIEFNDTSGNADGAIFADNGNLFINADYDNATADSSIRFRVDGSSEKMRIDSSGNVGIGITSPTHRLDVLNDGGEQLRLLAWDQSASARANIDFWYLDSGGTSYNNAQISTLAAANAGNGNLVFSTRPTSGSLTEAMRIDSSGNLLVGGITTLPSSSVNGFGVLSTGIVVAAVSNDKVTVFNRNSSDGDISLFQKDGSTVGSIGSNGGDIYVGNSDVTLSFNDVADLIAPTGTNGATRDGLIDLGNGGNRFDDIFATNGTIQTSDRNEKQDIAELTDAEQRVAVAAKGLLRKFRWRDAVEAKGDDARTHFGIIAQDLQAAFAAEGLDAGDYAMFISSTWTDEETGEERTRMGVRYSELLAFIIAAI